jgi:uncharacterized membrane protein YhaH (DUF805 family)
MQDLSPIGWAVRPLKNYAKFSGRASRAEFWWFFLFMMIIYMVVWFILIGTIGLSAASGSQNPMTMFGAFGVMGIFLILFYLALLIPTIAVQIRRLHDTNRSGWWLGAFWLLYIVYIGATFGMAFSATPGSQPPSLSGAGIMMAVGLAFFVYSIVLLVFFCLQGTRGPNRFGDDPYGADMGQVFA